MASALVFTVNRSASAASPSTASRIAVSESCARRSTSLGKLPRIHLELMPPPPDPARALTPPEVSRNSAIGLSLVLYLSW